MPITLARSNYGARTVFLATDRQELISRHAVQSFVASGPCTAVAGNRKVLRQVQYQISPGRDGRGLLFDALRFVTGGFE